MTTRAITLAFAFAIIAACDEGSAPPSRSAAIATPAPVARTDAADLIAKFECSRCHDIPQVAPAPLIKHCVHCHQEIHAGTFAVDALPDATDAPVRAVDASILARWQGRISSLRWAPSLAAADRLRRSWVRDFLLAPHDVRPGLVAEMPRLAITRDEAERLAAHLVPERDGHGIAVNSAITKRGADLYRSLACGRCHRFTGAAADDAALHASGRDHVEPLGGSWALAPDLRHARMRMDPVQIAAWIADPRGAMPRLGIADDDARALATFISTTPLAAPSPAPVIERRPVLARAVTWDEVEAKVFRRVCWHCHAVPDFARGDGGPGNSGGFGFAPRGLDLSSYTGISAGSLDDAGEPRSVFTALPDGTPRIIAHLLARHTEEAGSTVPGIRGMPLGLPPLPLDDIQLVETWISQGRPR